MITINANICFIDAFLTPWLGTGDDPDHLDGHYTYGQENEYEYKYFINRDIKPKIDLLNENVKQYSMDSLRGVLNSSEIDYEDMYDSYLPALPITDPLKKLYIWIWEVCFPGLPYELSDNEKIKLYKDVDDDNLIPFGY